MLDKINLGEKISNSKVDLPKETVSSNSINFQDIFDKLACLKKNKEPEQTNKDLQEIPEYYYPPINVTKYGLPPEGIAQPMYAVPSPEIEKNKNEQKDEPPMLKYAIPGKF